MSPAALAFFLFFFFFLLLFFPFFFFFFFVPFAPPSFVLFFSCCCSASARAFCRSSAAAATDFVKACGIVKRVLLLQQGLSPPPLPHQQLTYSDGNSHHTPLVSLQLSVRKVIRRPES